jgi:hypothetical protein
MPHRPPILEGTLVAHSHVFVIRRSGIGNDAVPAASPAHALQHVPQQFKATSGNAHLCAILLGTLPAHSQLWGSGKVAIGNFSVVASPPQLEGQVGDAVGEGERLGEDDSKSLGETLGDDVVRPLGA